MLSWQFCQGKLHVTVAEDYRLSAWDLILLSDKKWLKLNQKESNANTTFLEFFTVVASGSRVLKVL